jgi:hypothetical protein
MLVRGGPAQGLEGMNGISELKMTSTEDGEWVFIIQRDLKKD